MLTEERHAMILKELDKQGTMTLTALCVLLNTSESTVRRDLSILSEKGKLIRVRGGAISLRGDLNTPERSIEEKLRRNSEEKDRIGRYAASLIADGDIIFMDAGTTTGKMIGFLPDKNVTFVTNAIAHAKELAKRGFRVFLPAGEIRLSTEAIVGAECVSSLMNYNFTKSFIGTNGISLAGGISTPDQSEASVKHAAIRNSREAFVLADHTKFDRITQVRFSELHKVTIITDRLRNETYRSYANVREAIL